jgi:SAM-dependent methyltransferase
MKRNCPICGLESSNLYLEENFHPEKLNEFSFASRKEPELFNMRLYLCEPCDLLYANPALSQSLVYHKYENASFDSSVEAAYAARTYVKYLPQKKIINSALDIGTGGGDFLFELQKNGVKNICGIEPSSSAIATANKSVKPFIKQGFFDKNLYNAAQFDLVSCFQTLEHVFDPLKLSRDVNSILKNDGRFYVVAHNFRGQINRMMGKKSPIYDIEHLQLFSPKSLRNLLETAGFRNIEVFSIINTYPFSYWVKLLPKIPAKKQISSFIRKIKLANLPITLPIGNLAAIATK